MSEETPYVCSLSEEVQKIAKEELNESPEKRDGSIKELREKVTANKGEIF